MGINPGFSKETAEAPLAIDFVLPPEGFDYEAVTREYLQIICWALTPTLPRFNEMQFKEIQWVMSDHNRPCPDCERILKRGE